MLGRVGKEIPKSLSIVKLSEASWTDSWTGEEGSTEIIVTECMTDSGLGRVGEASHHRPWYLTPPYE